MQPMRGEMADRKQAPDWVAKRTKGNRIIGLVLLALVVLYVGLFVARYVIR